MSTLETRLSYQDYAKLAPKTMQAMYALGAANHDLLDPTLSELLKLRASQINGCAFCLSYHLDLARKANIPSAKLDLIAAWRDAGVFSPREMAALAWTEHLTDVSRQGAPDAAWTALQTHFTETEVMGLCAVIATINAWNRIAIALRFAPVVS
jgi:AhpD family alkylhydroperoxidase